jgi:hypothetical protein
MAMIMPTSNPFGLAWTAATSNMPNSALGLVMLDAPVRLLTGVGPGVCCGNAGTRAAEGQGQGRHENGFSELSFGIGLLRGMDGLG